MSASITGLVEGSTYHFRVRATNVNGTTYGGDQTFTASDTPPGGGEEHEEVAPPPSDPPPAGNEGQQPSPQTPPLVSPIEGQEDTGASTAQAAELTGAHLLVAGSNGILTLELRCPRGSCAGTITLRTLDVVASDDRHAVKHTLTLATTPFSLTGPRVVTIRLRLSATARALLAHVHTVRAQATIVVRQGSAAKSTAQGRPLLSAQPGRRTAPRPE